MAEAASSEKVLVELERHEAEEVLKASKTVVSHCEEAKKAWAERPDVCRAAEDQISKWGEIRAKLTAALDSTPQQFDLSSFRKEVEERLKKATQNYTVSGREGWDETEQFWDGGKHELEVVLALLPAEEETG